MPPDASVVLVEGAWSHREVTANGVRFHLAECGPPTGELVVLLHGFPEFWWSWRHQLQALGHAGYRVVAPDLRGYGGSDKPPRGYDAYTLSSDVAGMIRALGADRAHLVGHDWGGLLAWTAATLHPGIVASVCAVGMPHPLRLRRALLTDPAQIRASSYIGFFQLPKVPENRLLRDDAAYVDTLMRRWAGDGFPDAETSARCREAMQITGVAHSALEWYRWSVRSLTRPSGVRFQRLMDRGVRAPVLQVHGVRDGCLLATTAQGSAAWAHGGYRLLLLDGVGHFVQQEAPDAVTAALLEHLADARA
ncbi:MAG: alpha/beta hydrolase [Mycobacteriales bacterium]